MRGNTEVRVLAEHGTGDGFDVFLADGSIHARRVEPAIGVSTWWLNHADPHMRVLMDREGPFKKCAYDGHKTPTPDKAALPHVAPEAGIFD